MSDSTVVDMQMQQRQESTTTQVAPDQTRMPWAALVTMALTVFIVVSGEMMPAAVLPALATDLEVSLVRAGLLVSAWAAMVVVASFPLARLTARMRRPIVIAGALAVFALATLVTAMAPTYTVAMGSRLVAAGATGLLWATVNAHAAAIVPPRRIARAAAVVLFGGMLGTVAAIPAASALAGLFSWRVPFAGLGVLALAGAGAVAVVLGRQPEVGGTGEAAATASTGPRVLRALVLVAALGALVMASHFAAFTFVAELMVPSAVPAAALLLVFGLAGAAGVALVGVTSDRYPGVVPALVAGVMAVSLTALLGLGRHPGLDVAVMIGWGLVAGAVGPALQAALMRMAGATHRRTAGTLMPVAMNLGIALGAAAGSGVIDRWSLGLLPLLAALPALVAAGGLVGVAWRASARQQMVAYA